ncbi:MAG: 30S ribosomal protein S8 [Simkaniaceae bacterium]
MSVSDPVADLLTRIRNSKEAKHRFVDVKYSKLNLGILNVLKENGFIERFLASEEKYAIRVFLKYGKNRNSAIQGLQRISKPGARKYVGVNGIPDVYRGLGIAIMSTPKGVLDGKKAAEEKVGGEHLCNVW